MRAEDKERILTEVRSRVVQGRLAQSEGSGESIEEVLADSVYFERRRLKDSKDSRAARADQAFWKAMQRRVGRANERQMNDLLGQIVGRYADEICGNFDDRVYQVATRMIPKALGVLLNSVSPLRLLSQFGNLRGIDESLTLQGNVEHVRRMNELGTVVFAPTHVSNLDSIVLGFAIYQLGLPPVVYGAGLNLFTNPVMGFFMRNLGAYTIDRRKKDPLYKEVLKTYATMTLESGYNSLFFPGGTRCRSGAVERHLKLGLMGTNINAYVNNLLREAAQPNIYIIPTSLSYQLVLEAETLIDDFLRDAGKSRLIITDDEFSLPKKIFDFAQQLMDLNSRIYCTFGRALDPFGNPVDDDGVSIDPRGRRIDIERYVWQDGKPMVSPQRDREYTRELGERIAEAYNRDNVVQSTHVLARAVCSLLREINPGVDLVRLLRVGGAHEDMPLADVYREVGRLLGELRGLAGRGGIRLGQVVRDGAPEEVVTDGLRHFATFHQKTAVQRKGDRIFASDRNLIFYYQNRLEGYRFERTDDRLPALTDDHRGLREVA